MSCSVSNQTSFSSLPPHSLLPQAGPTHPSPQLQLHKDISHICFTACQLLPSQSLGTESLKFIFSKVPACVGVFSLELSLNVGIKKLVSFVARVSHLPSLGLISHLFSHPSPPSLNSLALGSFSNFHVQCSPLAHQLSPLPADHVLRHTGQSCLWYLGVTLFLLW